jgi:hypothetical protein
MPCSKCGKALAGEPVWAVIRPGEEWRFICQCSNPYRGEGWCTCPCCRPYVPPTYTTNTTNVSNVDESLPMWGQEMQTKKKKKKK